MMHLYEHIARALDALSRCESPQANASQRAHVSVWRDRIGAMQYELPRGSGFDAYPMIDLDRSNGERIVIVGSYHNMDEGGSYAGWTDYRVTVKASLVQGIELSVVGGNRDFKDYAYEVFRYALEHSFDETAFV
jgi:hypothetical protein